MTKAEREKLKIEKLNKIIMITPTLNKIIEKAQPYITAYNKALKNYWENGKNKDEFDKECIKAELFDFRYGIYGGNKPNWNYDLEQLNLQYKQLLK